MSEIGIFAAVLFGYGLVSRRLERLWISAPMAFVAAGIVLGPDCLGLISLELTSETGLLLAEAALVVVLFADASRIDVTALRASRATLPARLLGIGMPLTIALGTAAGALLLTGIEFWEAAMVAAVLAPTDAALGQAVVSSEAVPKRIRQAVNVESGLNDGLSIPFLFLFTGLALSETGVDAGDWLKNRKLKKDLELAKYPTSEFELRELRDVRRDGDAFEAIAVGVIRYRGREVFGHRPRQTQSIKGRGASTDFIENHQTARGGGVQNGRGLLHLDHEGRLSACNVVGRADARKNAIHHRQLGATGRDKGAGLCHDRQQRRLPKER